MMKLFGYIAVSLSLLSFFSCMHNQPSPRQNVDVTPLEKNLSEANQKLDKMYQRVSILQLMVDNQQREIQDLKTNAEKPTAGPPVSQGITEETLPIAAKKIPPPSPAEPPAAPVAAPPAPEPEVKPVVTPKYSQGKPAVPMPQKPIPVSSPEADALYKKAFSNYKNRNYKTAASLFNTYAARYPTQDLADNALYWAGECHYALKNYAAAVGSFKSVLKSYPEGNKIPDALLKIGYSYLALGNKNSGIDYLKKTVTNYPFSPAATKAEKKLKHLNKK